MKPSLSQDWTVRDAVQACPQAGRIFLQFKTACLGCRLDRFCTLAEVSRYYGLDLETLLAALREKPKSH